MMFRFSFIALLLCVALVSHAGASDRKVMAYRGASGHMQENSLSAFVLAAAMKSDYISMSLVMTRDNRLVVFGDIDITTASNVTEIFPERARQDGKYYIIDFSLAELQQLSITPETDEYPASLRIPTFTDVLSLLRQMEKVYDYSIGIALEIKKPWFHLNEGKDISISALDVLQRFHYGETNPPIFLQCHDPDELQRIHKTLLAPHETNFKLVQLIDSSDRSETQRLSRGKWAPYNFEWMFTRSGAKLLALYADAVSFDSSKLFTIAEDPILADFLNNIQVGQVKIHALFLNNSKEDISAESSSHRDILNKIYDQVNIDVFVTDSPASTLAFLKTREAKTDNETTGQQQPLFYTPTPLKE